MSKPNLGLTAAEGIARAMAGDEVGAARKGFSVVADLIKRRLHNPDDELRKAVENDILEAAYVRIRDVERAVERLEAASPGEPTAATSLAIFTAFARAYGQAEKGKRAFLLNALANAFNPEIYEQSMTRRLFAALDELDYGDLPTCRTSPKRASLQLLGTNRRPWHTATRRGSSKLPPWRVTA